MAGVKADDWQMEHILPCLRPRGAMHFKASELDGAAHVSSYDHPAAP